MNELPTPVLDADGEAVPLQGRRPLRALARNYRRFGPLRGLRIRKLLMGYAGVYAAALALLLMTESQALTAAAIGVMVPGAGLLYASHWLLALLSLAVVTVSLLLHPAITVLLWGVAALGAAFHGDHMPATMMWPFVAWLIPLLPPTFFAVMKFRSDGAHAKALARRAQTEEMFAGRESSATRSQPGVVAEPLDDRALTDLRFLLDRALQPVEDFNGLPIKEVIGTGALRYQLSWAQQALALYTYCRAPAFRGYLAEAQRNLILKMQDRRVWSYWFYENMLGNLQLDADPIRHENIMYSGYLGAMLGLYETTTGDQRFREPGSFTLRWNDKTVFEYDAKRIVEAVRRNFDKHAYCLFPCEPHLIYPVCNGFGIATVLLEQRLHPDQDTEQLIARYRDHLENEFLTSDGRFEGMIMTSWGLRSPRGDANDGIVGFLNHASAPEIAERNWEMLRIFGVERAGSGDFQLYGRQVDVGDISFTGMPLNHQGALTGVALGAAEMGDREAYDRIIAEIDRSSTFAPGNEKQHDKSVSNWARFNLAAARFLRPGGFHDIVNIGMPDEWLEGPLLDEVAYPDVLVCRAVSDGQTLELDLAPGTDTGGQQKLRLAQLKAGVSYRVEGAKETTIQADDAGHAVLHVELDTRKHISVVPF